MPQYIRCDNVPEFNSKLFMNWCEKQHIEIKYTKPGKPIQNRYIERFNRLFREDVLDAFYFNVLHQLRKLSTKWMTDYNFNHPHKSLGNKSPKEFLSRLFVEFRSVLIRGRLQT